MPRGYARLPELIAVSRGEAIEPGLRLFGLAHGLRARLAAGGEELLLEFERLRPSCALALSIALPISPSLSMTGAMAARVHRSP